MKIEGITGHIAVGRYLLQLGHSGAELREASRTERAHIRPRPTPVLLRPRLMRGLAGRRMELAAALSALDAELPIEVTGESGIGKTAFLRHLAHHPRIASFVDGVVYLPARHQSFADLQQLIFDAFHESEERCKPTQAEVRRGLQEKHALIILDDVRLIQDELEQVIDIAPRSSFAVATRERCLWGEVRSITLTGLPVEEAVPLLQREIERPLDADEFRAAERLCAGLAGHPLRILQSAALVRARGTPIGEWVDGLTPDGLITDLLESIDEKQRRTVLALAALSGVSLQSQHVAGIAEITDIEPSLATLVQRGLVVGTQSRYQLADGVVDRLRRLEDLKPWVNRAITYFIAWAERYRRNPDILLDEAEALLRVQQQAIDTRRWGEVFTLGRLLETTQVIHARWGAWAVSLDRCLAAAKAMGDRSAEAWALHQMGSRAVCLGETGNARVLLKRAVHLREVVDDETAVRVSRQNLALVLPPASERPPAPDRPPAPEAAPLSERAPVPEPPAGPQNRTRPTDELAAAGSQSRARPTNELPAPPRPVEVDIATPAVALDFASLPLRDAVHPAIPVAHTHRAGTLGLIVLLFAMTGAFAYWAFRPELIQPSDHLARISTFLEGTFRDAPTRTKRAAQPEEESRASAVAEPHAVATSAETEVAIVDAQPAATIRIFSPRPSSITRGGPTNLCYALNGALRARLEPGVGDVAPATMLTCQRVAPARTTTYELTAYGANGQAVRQQVVIVVR